MPSTMSMLSMMEAKLPPGFRFHPRDEELVCDYLVRKVAGDGDGSFNGSLMMIDVDLNKCEPWDLPDMACVGGKEWYFFSLRDRKYATGQRTNRATLSGYWKATGKDRQVARKGLLVGMRKTLVFYQGRAPKGRKTDWVMHEFRMEGNGSDPPRFAFKEDWVLCRVFYKSRGNSSKPSKETCYDDTSSSMLPPLTDIYITSKETPQSLKGYEQVPCFSKLPLNINQVVVPPIPMTERDTPFTSTTHLVGLPNLGSCLNPFPCDKNVVEVVLNHLTKLEGNQKREAPTTLAEGSQESYFSEISQPYIWNIF